MCRLCAAGPCGWRFTTRSADLSGVVISDRVLSLMPAHSYTLNRLMFVSVNALLLYLVAARYMKTIRISVAAREEALVRARGYFESSVEGIVSADSNGMIRQLNPRGQGSCSATTKWNSSVSRSKCCCPIAFAIATRRIAAHSLRRPGHGSWAAA